MAQISPEVFDRVLAEYARGHGFQAMLARVCLDSGFPMPPSLTSAALAAQRHLRMAQLLTTDEELVYRREKLSEGNRLLSAAARRALAERGSEHGIRPSEIVPGTDEPNPDLIKRLVAGFPYLMFDDPKRGLDKGLLF
jgi:hypothetical protein